jgi:hypothetical protein
LRDLRTKTMKIPGRLRKNQHPNITSENQFTISMNFLAALKLLLTHGVLQSQKMCLRNKMISRTK